MWYCFRGQNGIVQRFVEKPAKPDGNWAFSGVMVASQEIFRLFSRTKAGGYRLSFTTTADRQDGGITEFQGSCWTLVHSIITTPRKHPGRDWVNT